MKKFESHKLDMPDSRYIFYKNTLNLPKNRNRGRERQRLTAGSTRQRLDCEGRGFPAGQLDDGEVSAATKGTIVLYSLFRVD